MYLPFSSLRDVNTGGMRITCSKRLRPAPRGTEEWFFDRTSRILSEPCGELRFEFRSRCLEAAIGEKPRGGRQHWLRFDRHEKLFANSKSRLVYDSTLGFSEDVGFRNGASFAFPPYNFEREEPYRFLEIPLALMDSALISASQSSVEQAAKLTAKVLQESRRWGWGGIALLWHNPVEPLGVPDGINRIFWEQMKMRAQHQERWISAEEFLALSLARYQRAGLLKGVESVAQAANC